MADRTGQQLGNYRVIRPIGRGGFAEVYLGELVPAAGSDLLNVMILVFNYFLSAGSVAQDVDLTHQHILFSIPFIGFSNKPPFIVPTLLIFSVESITFMITQGMRNFAIAFLAIPIPFTTNPGHMGISFTRPGMLLQNSRGFPRLNASRPTKNFLCS